MLEYSYDNLSNIPEEFQSLYSENNGKYVLTEVNNIKTQDDVERIQASNAKERLEHKKTKEKLSQYDDIRNLGLSGADILSKLDRFEELEAAAAGKLDEEQINKIAETRSKTRAAPLEREKTKLQEQLNEALSLNEKYATKERTNKIHAAVRDAATKGKVVNTAIDDVLILAERVFDIDEMGKVITKDGVGVTPFIDPTAWLNDMTQTRPHWFPQSVGGGASGSSVVGFSGTNPFNPKTLNYTEQGKLLKDNPDLYHKLRKSAGK